MERKRQLTNDYSAEGSSSYSARARYPANAANDSPNARPPPAYAQYRTESPPASAYFSHFSGDHHEEPQPSRPDTNAHFAYSTTLRRHTLEGPLGLPPPPPGGGITSIGELRSVVETEGARGLWERTGGRLTAAFTQREQFERLPMHREETQAKAESVSARFAHYSIQVRCHSFMLQSQRPTFPRIRWRTSAPLPRTVCLHEECRSSWQSMATTSLRSPRQNPCSSSSRRQYTRTP